MLGFYVALLVGPVLLVSSVQPVEAFPEALVRLLNGIMGTPRAAVDELQF
jgi:hypothetical protein